MTEASHEPMKLLERSVDALMRLHVEREVPATFFIVGKTLEMGHAVLRRLRDYPDLFDVQQHTYSHLPLKSINPAPDLAALGNDFDVVGGSPGRIAREVRRTSDLIANYLDAECTGLRGPWGYYRGLSDRPDILRVLSENGIEFTSTYLRNRLDYFPVPLAVQPFTYADQGFPGVMEIPSQDWIDCAWRTVYGWKRTTAFAGHMRRVVGRAAERGLVLGTCFHDWSVIMLDPELTVMRELFDAAEESKMKVESYGGYHARNAA